MKVRTKSGTRVALSNAAGKECVELLENRRLLSTTYYVSPTGSDSNAGTATGTAWATATKVNATAFQPGDQILFQRGGEWHSQLTASSSGTAANPIVYGDYGSGTKPIFDGSDVIPSNAFSLVSGSTYSFNVGNVLNSGGNAYWVYANHAGMLAAAASDSSTGGVQSNANSFYINGSTVYINTGGTNPATNGVTYTLGDRGAGTAANSSLINSNGKDYVTFSNIIGRETAEVGGGNSLTGGIADGYVYRIQGGTKITMNNIEGYYGSKHIIGAINTQNFTCNGAVFQGCPQAVAGNGLPYGNATATVSFADAGQTDEVHKWINVTVSNYDGAQPAFLTHNDGTNSIKSILLQNFNSFGAPVALQPGTNVAITMIGGSISNNTLTAYTSTGTTELIDGVKLTGNYPFIQVNGNAIVQNCLITDSNQPAIQVTGPNNVIRFNTIKPYGYATAIDLRSGSTNDSVYGNLITGSANAISIASGVTYTADYDFFDSSNGNSSPNFSVAGTGNSLAQFQASGHETHGIYANAAFTSSGTGDYSLSSTSPAINFVPTSASITGITSDIRGFTRPSANVYDAGAYEFQSTLHQPTIATAASANPNPVTGTTTNLSVLGASVDGEATLTYTWSLTGSPPAGATFSANGTNAAKNTTATFTKAGSYTFQANVSNGSFSTTSSVVVTVNQTATGVTISPPTMFVAINTTQQYVAIVADQFGNAVSGSSVTYSIQSGGGSINSSGGLFTAPGSTGTTVIKATSGASSATATATITPPNQAPTVATAAAATPNPVTSTTTTLSVLGADDNGEANLIYTWSILGTPPAAVTFSANGTNAAKSSVATFTANGSYNFLVTIKDSGGLTTTSSVTVTVSIFVPIVVDGTLDGRYGTPIAVQTQATNVGYNSIGSPVAPYSQLSAIYGVIDATSGQLDLFIAGSLNLQNAHLDLFIDSVSGAGAANTGALATAAASNGPWNTNGGFTQITFDSGFRPDHLFTSTYGGGYSLSYYNFDTNTETNNTLTDPATGLATSSGNVPYFTERVNNAKENTIIAANTGGGILTGAEWAFNLSSIGYTVANYNAGVPIGIMAFISFGSHTQDTNQNLAPSSTLGYGAYSYFGNNFDFSSASAFPGNQFLTVGTPAAPAGPSIATPASATPNPVSSGNTTALSVLAADSAGESTCNYTWTLTGTPPAAVVFSANGTNAAKNSTATFSANGTYNFLVTVTDATNVTATSTVTVTVNSFGTVTNQPPTVVTPAAAATNPVTGKTTALSVLGNDDGGESNLTYTWATTGTPPAAVSFDVNGTNGAKNSIATFSKSGTYNFMVTITDAGGLFTTSTVTAVVVNQTPTTVTLTPASVSVVVNATQQFAATVYDQFGTVISSPSLTWSVLSGGGNISTGGLYTAPASPGSATVKVLSGTASATSTITITFNQNGPSVVNPAAAGNNPVTGTSTTLSVLGTAPTGAASLTYTWTSTSVPGNAPPVTFSVNGSNAAANTTAYFYQAGTYTLTATIKDPNGNITTSTVVVSVNQTVTTLYVLPPKVILAGGASQQFTVRATDQFSNTIFSPATTWSVTSGKTISSSGLFAGGQATGTYTVSALVGGVTATTTVTVTASGAAVATLSALTTVVNTIANIGNADLVMPGGGALGLATAEAMIKTGANLTGGSTGYWKGASGITSSAAASDATFLTAVGVILNNDGNTINPAPLYTTFDHANTSLNDVLVKYTYYGDSNLDGKVDASDYSRIDSGYLTHGNTWAEGDYNYDGTIDGSDYTLIDNAFNRQGAAKASQIADAAATKALPAAITAAATGSSCLFSNTPIASVASEIFGSSSSDDDKLFSGR